jgi:hypothetical protein
MVVKISFPFLAFHLMNNFVVTNSLFWNYLFTFIPHNVLDTIFSSSSLESGLSPVDLSLEKETLRSTPYKFFLLIDLQKKKNEMDGLDSTGPSCDRRGSGLSSLRPQNFLIFPVKVNLLGCENST